MGSLHMTVKLRQVGRKFKTAAPSSPPFPTTSAVAHDDVEPAEGWVLQRSAQTA
jgi:hypothetical protein